MLFPKIKIENKVQVDDKTRIESFSFAEGENITLVEISPDNGTTFFDCTDNGYLDWQFDSEGTFPIIIRVTGDVTGPIQSQKTILVVTEAEDNLFSNDNMLIDHEDDILGYVRDGRDSFIDKHRTAQAMILNDLDKSGVWKDDNSRYTASDIVDIQEFAEWSKFLTLRLIFEAVSNAVGDVFEVKADRYMNMETSAKNRAYLRLDPDGDGNIDDTEIINIRSGDLIRG